MSVSVSRFLPFALCRSSDHSAVRRLSIALLLSFSATLAHWNPGENQCLSESGIRPGSSLRSDRSAGGYQTASDGSFPSSSQPRSHALEVLSNANIRRIMAREARKTAAENGWNVSLGKYWRFTTKSWKRNAPRRADGEGGKRRTTWLPLPVPSLL